MAEIANILQDLLKSDIVIDLNNRVTNPFDLLQLPGQLHRISDASAIESSTDQVIEENPVSKKL